MGQLARQRIFESRGPKANDRLILLSLADCTPDDRYTCYPSVNTLAEMSGMSDRQAQRVIASLYEQGKIDKVEGRGRNHTTKYAVLVGLSEEERVSATIELKGDITVSPIPTTKGDIKGDSKHDTAMSPFNAEKVTDLEEKVTDRAIKGDIAVSPEQNEQIEQNIREDATQALPAPIVKRERKKKEPNPDQSHPAVIAFYEKTARRPNQEQAHLIAERVTDVPRWQRTMTFWLQRGWSAMNVGGMVNRYERVDDLPPDATPYTNGSANSAYPPIPIDDPAIEYASAEDWATAMPTFIRAGGGK